MNVINWIIQHWGQIGGIVLAVLVVAEMIVNLTPTEKDNSILLKIKNWISKIFPNYASDGGKFIVESKSSKTRKEERQERKNQ